MDDTAKRTHARRDALRAGCLALCAAILPARLAVAGAGEHDPALIAAHEDREAAAALSATSLAHGENSPEWAAAERRMFDAADTFADTVPTTSAGALEKMKSIAEWGALPGDDTQEARHIRTVMAYLDRQAGRAGS